jgi:hypothetical protein
MNENDPDSAPPTERYVPSAKKRGRPPPEALKVHIELVVVDGEEGKALIQRQATVVREALRWFADNPLIVVEVEETATVPIPLHKPTDKRRQTANGPLGTVSGVSGRSVPFAPP